MLRLNTVLCAIDFEPGSERALIRAADIAERAHASLHLLHISPLFRARLAMTPNGSDSFRDQVAEFVNRVMGASDAFSILDPVVHHGHGEVPAEGLVRYAQAVGAGLIVLGTHGRKGLGHIVLGSVADDVVRTASVPVLVIPDRATATAPDPTRPVLAAVDFSEHTLPLLQLAANVAESFDAQLELVHVMDRPIGSRLDLGGFLGLGDLPTSPDATDQAKAKAALVALAKEIDVDLGSDRAHVCVGTAEVEISAMAGELGAGLVVLGTHGRTGWAKLRLGSVAESVLRMSECPVLALPLRALAENTDSSDAVEGERALSGE